jgi:hypothetical protein
MCVTEQRETAVAEAMAGVFSRVRVRCQTLILHADNHGTRVRRS